MARYATRSASLLLAVILSGCASPQTFRVVDAKSGEPLDDVRVERLDGSYHFSKIPFVIYDELAPTEGQTTSTSGSVTFQKSGSKFMFNPSGKNPAFNDAYVTTTWSGAKVVYPAECREFAVSSKDGVIEIPLRRRWIGGEDPRGQKTAASREENQPKVDVANAAQHDDRSGIADTGLPR